MEMVRLIGRNSRLSLLQLEIVKQKLEAAFDNVDVQIIARSSCGDALQDVPLHTVEGSDFFTQDIFDALSAGEADIAVHSLKDMSAEHFFSSNKFAVVDRDDTRDVLILTSDAQRKIEEGSEIVIGTCSPRREEMAIGFLQRALPQLNIQFKVRTKFIRGNVDTRLRKLDNGEYDGTILATAGLNRLLRSSDDAKNIRSVLAGKRLILLPLIECVPAPCQGAIVAEAHPSNEKAVRALAAININKWMNACTQEKRLAKQYGAGCIQKFGVTTIDCKSKEVLYAAGRDSEGTIFSKWSSLPELDLKNKNLFSTTDLMGRFFEYTYNNEIPVIHEDVVYVANYKAVEHKEIIEQLRDKRVWASGTKTWFELAKKGIWVEGCADAFGLEFLEEAWQMPLLNISKKEVAILTSNDASEIWRGKGWNVYGTYSTNEKNDINVEQQIRQADLIFWTSYRQYSQFKDAVKTNVVHMCSYGETAEQFRIGGIEPVLFPNIKAFQQWKQTFTRLRSVV